MSTSRLEWPTFEARYEDEYGALDPAVYEVARSLWPKAERFGTFALHDPAAAFDLMHKAVARVSNLIARGDQIRNVAGYLYQTYKHLIAQEKAKQINRHQPLKDVEQSLVVDITRDLERKIALREAFEHMDEVERHLTLCLMFGYSYEETAEIMGTPSATLRQQFSRLKKRIAKILGGEATSTG